ncbi:MAG: DUF1573 domain-containing protein, partial [Verrucomicrobia bacterium]|nr:DUF1573 domain-containing protein [Verrucomicrobiota bacterium]
RVFEMVMTRPCGRLRLTVLVLATLAGLNSGLGFAQEPAGNVTIPAPTVPAPAPRIALGSPVYDFGRIKSGEVVEHSFVFTNQGNAPLEITAVRPGCGCTTAGEWDRVVPPGRAGAIPLRFNSTGYSGAVAKSAMVTCNDPSRRGFVLQLRGTIWKPIDVVPSLAVFNVTSETLTGESKVLRIVSNLEQPITLSHPECSNAQFRAEVKPIRPGKEFELRITAIPPFGPRPTYAPVTLRTSAQEWPVILAGAYLAVQPVIEVSPRQLVLPPGPLTGNFISSITIRNNGTNALVLSDPKANVPGVQVRLVEADPGRRFALAVTFPAGFQAQPGRPVEISVGSNHPGFATIRVPVVQPAGRSAVQTGAWLPRPPVGSKSKAASATLAAPGP